jgi:hypothetical protein
MQHRNAPIWRWVRAKRNMARPRNAAEKSGIDAWVNYADKSFRGCVTDQSAMLTKIFARVCGQQC